MEPNKGERVKIAMVSWHGCIRVFKESLALQQAGHSVYLITHSAPWGVNLWDKVCLYVDKNQLARTIRECDADIFHVHNEPDWLVPVVREGTKRPVIFDVHDLESLRWGNGPNQVEYDAFRAADGFVHVSDPCRFAAEQFHGSDKPTRVILSYVNREFVAPEGHIIPAPSFRSIVYEGGLDATEDPQPIAGEPHKFKVNIRNFIRLFGDLYQQGFSVNVLSASPVVNNRYEEVGTSVAPPMSYQSMLFGLRPFGLGFVGAAFSAELMEFALPNKLFEYMSQGVVPFCLFAKESARFLEQNECGFSIKHPKELLGHEGEYEKYRRNVLARRHEFVMELQTESLLSLYEEVMK